MKMKVFSCVGMCSGVITSLLGGWDTALQTLVLFMIIDWFTGGILLPAVFQKSPKSEHGGLESRVGWKGLCRKGMMLVFVMIAVRLDLLMATSYLRDAVCIAFIANEAVSIVENAGIMGMPLPEVLVRAVQFIRLCRGTIEDGTDKAVAKEVVKRTYLSAVELFSYLCKLYNLNSLGKRVILSHNEGYKKGIATNHGDPEHLWRGLGLDYTMDRFREAVYDEMKKEEKVEVVPKTKPYLVRVEASNLNIRKGPDTTYERTGKYTGVGTFTIVEEADGPGAKKWGKLKNGAGWISLDYTKAA